MEPAREGLSSQVNRHDLTWSRAATCCEATWKVSAGTASHAMTCQIETAGHVLNCRSEASGYGQHCQQDPHCNVLRCHPELARLDLSASREEMGHRFDLSPEWASSDSIGHKNSLVWTRFGLSPDVQRADSLRIVARSEQERIVDKPRQDSI